MFKTKKAAAFLLSAALVVSFAGCNKGNETSVDDSFGESYPLETDVKLSYWMPLHENVTASVATFAETEFAKEAEKKTGVKVEYLHPAVGATTEQFNLLIASGDLPDIILHSWFEFSGGPSKAISDGYIIPLNDYLDKYAPNLAGYLKENTDVDKMIKTDEGQYYLFPTLIEDESMLMTAGPIVRQDLLDKLNIKTPVTYDDWYNMLKKFKEAGVEIPLNYNSTNTWEIQSLIGTFGARTDFYLENGKIKFGPFDPEFKETLQMLNKWFEEGLIDRNFSTTDAKIREASMLSGKIGVAYGSGGGQLGKWIGALPKDSEIKLGTIPYPKKNADDTGAKFKVVGDLFNSNGSAVTTSCKNPALAVKYLDFFYGDEGHMLANFGVEGKSYNMVDGYPTYTEEITKNPEGLSMSQAMAKYMLSYSAKAMVQDKRYLEQYYSLPEQQKALSDWCEANDYAMEQKVPKILCTSEEAFEMAEITNNVNTYRDQMILKFITGTESFDNYDAFINQMKAFKIEKAVEIQQNAYERYMKR